MSPSKRKLIKKVNQAIEIIDKQINDPDGIDEDKRKELLETRERLEKSKKDLRRRSFDLSLPV